VLIQQLIVRHIQIKILIEMDMVNQVVQMQANQQFTPNMFEEIK